MINPTDRTRQHVCVFCKSRRSLITSGQPTDRPLQHVCVFCKSRRSLITSDQPTDRTRLTCMCIL